MTSSSQSWTWARLHSPSWLTTRKPSIQSTMKPSLINYIKWVFRRMRNFYYTATYPVLNLCRSIQTRQLAPSHQRRSTRKHSETDIVQHLRAWPEHQNKNTRGAYFQYADDTNMYVSFKPAEMARNVHLIKDDLSKVVEWSSGNNLIFNAAKTKSILFGTRQMLRTRNLNDPDFYTIEASGITIEWTSSYKVLGIIFTDDFSWNQHINHTHYYHLTHLSDCCRWSRNWHHTTYVNN